MLSPKRNKETAEFRLLIHCLRLGNKGYAPEPDKVLVDAVDWETFLALADQQHRVLGIIYQKYTSHDCDFIPGKILARIKRRNRSANLRMLELTAELIRVTEMLKNRGIKVLAYKGPVLGIQLFGSPVIRRSGDLDIVVPKACIQEAKNLIQASGYEPCVPSYDYPVRQTERFLEISNHFNFFHPKGITLELHWRFFSSDLCAINFEKVWENRQPVRMGGRLIYGCAPEDTLILLLLHGGKHRFNRLFWLYDIWIILNSYGQKDWIKLMERVRVLRIERPAYYTFYLLEHLLGMTLPQDIKKEMAKDKQLPLLIRLTLDPLMTPQPEEGIFESKLKELVFRFTFLPRCRYRIKIITASFSFWESEFFPLPDRLRFLYYPLRPFLWVFRQILKIRPLSRSSLADRGV